MANYPGSPPSGTPSTHGDVLNEVIAIAKAPPAHPPYITGRRVWQPGMNAISTQLGEAIIYVSWWALPMGTAISEVRFEIVTAGSTGAVARVVFYDHGLATGDPAGLLWESPSTISTETTGEKSHTGITGLSVVGADGIWAGLIPQGAPATRAFFRGISATLPGPQLTSSGAFNTTCPGLASTAATFTGAAPATYPAYAFSGAVPKLHMTIG
jgi:hypothetical protein